MTLGTNNEYSAPRLYTMESETDNPGEREIKGLIKGKRKLEDKMGWNHEPGKDKRLFQIAEVVVLQIFPCKR